MPHDSGSGYAWISFLWILLCAGTPDLYDAIQFALTDGALTNGALK
jgi:hypothetical protein